MCVCGYKCVHLSTYIYMSVNIGTVPVLRVQLHDVRHVMCRQRQTVMLPSPTDTEYNNNSQKKKRKKESARCSVAVVISVYNLSHLTCQGADPADRGEGRWKIPPLPFTCTSSDVSREHAQSLIPE